MKWETSTLGELAEQCDGVIQTGPFGSQLHQIDYRDSGVPVVMPQDIIDDGIKTDSIAYVNDFKARELSRHILNNNDIIYPRRGDLNKRAIIKEKESGWLCGTGCIKISVQGSSVLPNYLFYYLKESSIVQHIENQAVGSTMKNLSAKILKSIEVRYPPLPTQKRIADILSKYDDLIDNNNRRIALLEESVHLLYREWFVRLRFPGHESVRVVDGVPEGWERKRLKDWVTLNYGKTLTKKDRKGGFIPVYGSSGVVGYHNQPLVKGSGIILGRKGNVGSIFWSFNDFFPIDTVFYLEKDDASLFNLFLLKSLVYVNTDAAVPGLNRNYVYNLEIIIPNSKSQYLFEDFAKSNFNQIQNLQQQNQKLEEARDSLLPRLMNGNLEV